MMPLEVKTIEVVLGIAVFAVTTFIGLAVFLKNPKSWTHRFFLLIAAYIDIYDISNFLSLHPPIPTPGGQLFWIRVVMFFSAFLGPLLVFFTVTFPRAKFQMKKRYSIPLILLMGATAILSFTPLIFQGVQYPNGQPVPVPGPGIFLYFIDFVALIALSSVIMVRKYHRATGIEKAGWGTLLVGMAFSFSILAVLTFVLVVFFKTSATVFLGPSYLFVLLAAIAYAISRYHLLDIKPIIVRIVSFVALVILLAAAYSLALLLIADRFIPINLNLFIVFLILLAVTALSFEPLERLMRHITNKIFFAGSYDSNALLSELTSIMAETIDLGALTDQILKKLMGSMNISKGAFLIMREHVFVNIFGIGYDKGLLAASGLEDLFHGLSDVVPYFLFDDLEEESLKQLFRSFDISVAIPIRVEKREVALLVLGEKKSGEVYYSEDLKFLNTFALSAGVAIDNAQSYAEIKEFNKELEGRVEERTKELKEIEERELAEARNVSRLKDEFVFVAAHELRTPIAAIRGFLQMVSETKVKFPRDVKQNLKAINSASDILNQLINDLLEIARSESGTVKVFVQPTDIIPIVQSVIKEMSSLARKQKVRVRFQSRGKVPRALVDPDKAREIVMNLVSNGIKYNKAGGTLTVDVSKKGLNIVMEFKDTGYGIPKDQQEHIFQKFFRVHGKDTQEVSGTGLGLFIVRMLADKMGGAVTFKSSEGKGSTFAVSFRLEK